MTVSEKANSLITSMHFAVNGKTRIGSLEQSKRCAAKIVDNIIKELCDLDKAVDVPKGFFKYWDDVKLEINSTEAL